MTAPIVQRPKALTKILVQDKSDPASVADALHRMQDQMLAVLNPTLRNPVATSAGDTAWSLPTLLGSWANYNNGYMKAGYFKDGNGRIWLRGTVASGGIGTAIFTLPTGYRPTATVAFAASTNIGFGQGSVDASGNVIALAGGTGLFSLDGISFDMRA